MPRAGRDSREGEQRLQATFAFVMHKKVVMNRALVLPRGPPATPTYVFTDENGENGELAVRLPAAAEEGLAGAGLAQPGRHILRGRERPVGVRPPGVQWLWHR